MSWKKIIAVSTTTLCMFISACGLQIPVAGTNPEPANPTVNVETRVAEAIASTAAAQTAIAEAVAGTFAAMSTNTPEFTFTPSVTLEPTLTPTPTSTFTPNTLMVSVSVETNCRSGPGKAYDILGVLPAGQPAEVVGHSTSTDNWIIKLPSKPSVTCWIWSQYATVSGNTADAPDVPIPPTPTPAAAFTVAFVDTTACAGEYAFQFQVDNTGSVTWESISIVITNNNDSTTTTHTRDSFRSYEGCTLQSNQQNLEAGEGGLVANINPGQLLYNPAGIPFTAVVKVCPEDGLAGTCLTKTINFTP